MFVGLKNDTDELIKYKSRYQLSNNSKITLYQDAETFDKNTTYEYPLPMFRINDETYLKTHRCWKDIYDALLEAKKFVYILSWEFNPAQGLLRNSTSVCSTIEGTEIGFVLKNRASDGVDVRILLWDARKIFWGLGSSHNPLGKEVTKTIEYFRNTGVIVEVVTNNECGDCKFWEKNIF